MRAELTRVLPCSYTQLGFIEPGHGLKGKTQWLRDDDDVSSASLSSSSSTSATCISPSKRVSLRTESIKQLELWHSLLENGGITKDQYKNLKCTILEDIKGNF